MVGNYSNTVVILKTELNRQNNFQENDNDYGN